MRFPVLALLVGASFVYSANADAGIHSLLREFTQQPAQTPHPAIVRVEVIEPGAVSHGSGSLIGADQDYGWVVTNWHVVRGAADNVTVQFPGGFTSPAAVMKTDEDWDLALLAIHRPPVAPLNMAGYVPTPGEPLFIAGYGQGKFRVASGNCLGYAAPEVGFPQEMIDVSVPARQGDSGGPIVNAQGEIVGVLFGSGGGLTTGTHVGRLRQFLAEVSLDMPSTAGPTKTEVAGTPMTSHRETQVTPEPVTTAEKQPPADVPLPSTPALTLTPPAKLGAFDPDTHAVVDQADLLPDRPYGTALPLLNPQSEWGETQAFFVFVTVIGTLLLLSPKRR